MNKFLILNKNERWFLELLDRADEPLFCDGIVVNRLVAEGLIREAYCGWAISPSGRSRLEMLTA